MLKEFGPLDAPAATGLVSIFVVVAVTGLLIALAIFIYRQLNM